MSSSPPSKRQKSSAAATAASIPGALAEPSAPLISAGPVHTPIQPSQLAPKPAVGATTTLSAVPQSSSPINPRKRRATKSPQLDLVPPGTNTSPTESNPAVSIPSLLSEGSEKKRGRTNTPWTPAEEQRLKQMRDLGNSWSEIAKAFPARTEGSVKKHWYKDMHYAEFAEDESAALREAIREYEANKWKVIGQKLGKPAKACEQFAREHFKNL